MGIETVLLDCEDDLVSALVVVGKEQLLVIAVETVSIIHEILQQISALVPLGSAGIDLGAKVKLGKKELGGTHSDMAINH